MPSNRKRSHRSPSASRRSGDDSEHSRASSPKRQRSQEEENTLTSILSIVKDLKEDLTKTNNRVELMESRLAKPDPPMANVRHDDDLISVMAYSDSELDFSEDLSSQASGPPVTTVKPSHSAIRPSNQAIRPSDQALASTENGCDPPTEKGSDPPKESLSATEPGTTLYGPDATPTSWEPKSEFSAFLEKQFRRKLLYDQVLEILDNYNIPSVDCLYVPTLDPSILNQISQPQTKKFVQ